MLPGQTLFQSSLPHAGGPGTGVSRVKPDLAIVQGDTTTTLCGALAAFYARVPIGHVEAGLRTWDMAQPFPEEMNRVLTGRLADIHFPATPWAAQNLLREGVPAERIHVTGNTGIDAVLYVRDGLADGTLTSGIDWSFLNPAKRLILVTAHRRESFGDGFERICQAPRRSPRREDVEIVYPVHPNPNVQDPVNRLLAGLPNVSPHRAPRLHPLRRPHAARLSAHHRFGRRPGRRALARQADSRPAREDRTPRSRRSRHRQARRHRRKSDRN